MVAVTAKYNPFAEKAGMRKIAEQQAAKSVAQISKVLFEVGFDLQLLGSERYVRGKLEDLNPEQTNSLNKLLNKSRSYQNGVTFITFCNQLGRRLFHMPSESEESDFIPSVLFDQIVKYIPIASVDAVIVIDNSLLLLRRNNSPAKGEWWFPGGRIKKGESLEEALRREIKEETGLEISEYKLINVYSRVFPQRHDITIAYLCKCKEGKITLNDEHSEYALLNGSDDGLHQYIIEVIRDCNLKKLISENGQC
jgi:colanic acid biosynthesis protein WcaH